MHRIPALFLVLIGLMAAAPQARAETRYLAFDARDRVTRALTNGVTLEVERSLLGGISVRGLASTTQRGSARFRSGGPGEARAALPEGARGDSLYQVSAEGDGRGLARALCPGADEAWLAISRIRLGRPMTMQAVGRWADGRYRHCVALSYDWRGEWAAPPRRDPGDTPDTPSTPLTR